MKKLILLVLTVFALSIGGCSNLSSRKNSITNIVVEYQEMSIADFETAIETAVKRVEDAVIGITAKQYTPKEQVTIGSGVIYKRVANLYNRFLGEISGNIKNYTYYVITNRHVVQGSDPNAQTSLFAYINKGDTEIEIPAQLSGFDTKVDVALVTFTYDSYIVPVEFGDSSAIKKGSFAIAVGNPDGYDFYGSVTFGVISSPERYISDDTDNDGTNDFDAHYIQHDVAINPGNSGGGLFDIYGHLIGINTLKFVKETIDNMGFAIPANIVQRIVTEYLELKKPIVRPRLGILGAEVRSLSPDQIEENDMLPLPDIYDGAPYGLYVLEVSSGGSIANSNIKAHDIILEFDGFKITRTHILTSKLNSLIDYRVGDQVEVSYFDRSTNEIRTTLITLKP